MRRKSERTASKKAKASPEKKVEKVKRTRTRRSRKQSTSSENDSADEKSPVREVESAGDVEKKPPQTPVKEASPEDAPDQVWQVKTTEGSGDVGEIQKLKICLTRPPSTPERVDRSPRSRRKHSRATSSSDTPSVEGVDEKRKTKQRSKRSRDSKDGGDKNQDSQEEQESEAHQDQDKSSDEVTQSETVEQTETPMSTTNEEVKANESENVIQSSDDPMQRDVPSESTETEEKTESHDTEKPSDADTTVVSPKNETRVASPTVETSVESNIVDKEVQPSEVTQKSPEQSSSTEKETVETATIEQEDSQLHEKSEILELHADDSKIESDTETGPAKEEPEKEQEEPPKAEKPTEEKKVSEENISKETENIDSESNKATNKTDVVESSDSIKETNELKQSSESESKPETETKKVVPEEESNETKQIESVTKQPAKEGEPSNSVQSTDEVQPKNSVEVTKEVQLSNSVGAAKEVQQVAPTNTSKDEPIANGQAAPIVVSRKRRWGSRTSKLTTQKSITISTDVLKDIIPDVKPVEFDEVIEEKKHRRPENQERMERPVLPKIVIDNTDNVEIKKEHEEKSQETPKPRDLASNRKISIIKENESIIARPPSPPRNKQSCILYITNLVRPFTLPQLKNLLQRTGRIVENGFWIDRIKSKCFVHYETEDQAVETRHALHGVTWPVSNPKTLQVDFSTTEAFEKAKTNEETEGPPVSTIPGTVEDWLREQDMKRERGELEKPWERKAATREWDLGKNDKDKEKDKLLMRRDERPIDKRRHRSPEKSPEPARKFKKKEEEPPAKLLDDLFRKTKTTPCIYWLPLSAETIAIKEEQRRQHMAEHERRLQELRRTPRRH